MFYLKSLIVNDKISLFKITVSRICYRNNSKNTKLLKNEINWKQSQIYRITSETIESFFFVDIEMFYFNHTSIYWYYCFAIENLGKDINCQNKINGWC